MIGNQWKTTGGSLGFFQRSWCRRFMITERTIKVAEPASRSAQRDRVEQWAQTRATTSARCPMAISAAQRNRLLRIVGDSTTTVKENRSGEMKPKHDKFENFIGWLTFLVRFSEVESAFLRTVVSIIQRPNTRIRTRYAVTVRYMLGIEVQYRSVHYHLVPRPCNTEWQHATLPLPSLPMLLVPYCAYCCDAAEI